MPSKNKRTKNEGKRGSLIPSTKYKKTVPNLLKNSTATLKTFDFL